MTDSHNRQQESVCKKMQMMLTTYTATTHEDNDKRLKPTTDTNDPHQTNEQDHSKDVLDAWKVDAKNRTKLPRLLHTNFTSKQRQ